MFRAGIELWSAKISVPNEDALGPGPTWDMDPRVKDAREELPPRLPPLNAKYAGP